MFAGVRLFLTLAGAFCAVLVITVLSQMVQDEGRTMRTLVIDGLLVAAGLRGTFDCWRLSRDLQQRFQGRRTGWRPNGRYEVPAKSTHSFIVTLFAAAIAIGAVVGAIVSKRSETWIPATALVAMAALMFSVFRSLPRSGAPVLWMDANGLHHIHYGYLPWMGIHDMSLEQVEREDPETGRRLVMGTRLLLTVDSPGLYRARVPAMSAGLTPEEAATNEAQGMIVIWLHLLDVMPGSLLATAKRLHKAGKGRQTDIASPAFERESDIAPLTTRERLRVAWVAVVSVAGATNLLWMAAG